MAWAACPIVTIKDFSTGKAKLAFDYLRTDLTRLMPAPAPGDDGLAEKGLLFKRCHCDLNRITWHYRWRAPVVPGEFEQLNGGGRWLSESSDTPQEIRTGCRSSP